MDNKQGKGGWQKWRGQVIGTDGEIRSTYEKLGAEATRQQIEDEIFREKSTKLELTLKKADDSFW